MSTDKKRPDYVPPKNRVVGAACRECGDLRQPNGFFRMDEDLCCALCGRDASVLYGDGTANVAPEEEDGDPDLCAVCRQPKNSGACQRSHP